MQSKVSQQKIVTPNAPVAWTVQELGTFYKDHRKGFVALATRILKDKSRAEEVVQDAVIKVMLAAPELESREHAIAYVNRAVQNLCIDILRLEGRRPNLVVLGEDISDVQSLWAGSESISEEIMAAEDATIIRQALSLLSSAERAALVMWEIEGRSTKEIAKELGIKESTVRHTVSRARASLRRVLSEIIIDEKRGLTAVDLLSSTFVRASQVAKKSSKAALSLFLLLFSILGFNSIQSGINIPTNTTEENASSGLSLTGLKEASKSTALPSESTVIQTSPKVALNSNNNSANLKSRLFTFAGLDVKGVPTGFTVTDSKGDLGSLYTSTRPIVSSETELSLYQIVKTDAGAANIFLSQRFLTDSSGFTLTPTVSYGKAGTWVPLVTSVTYLDSERLLSGEYLVSALIKVESEVETAMIVPATASGRDLLQAPLQVITRIVLNAEKTQVLAQAIQVVERE